LGSWIMALGNWTELFGWDGGVRATIAHDSRAPEVVNVLILTTRNGQWVVSFLVAGIPTPFYIIYSYTPVDDWNNQQIICKREHLVHNLPFHQTGVCPVL
jgi:hypothetical protein